MRKRHASQYANFGSLRKCNNFFEKIGFVFKFFLKKVKIDNIFLLAKINRISYQILVLSSLILTKYIKSFLILLCFNIYKPEITE